MEIKAVIFDMDGTMLDTGNLWVKSAIEVNKNLRYNYSLKEIKSLIGKSVAGLEKYRDEVKTVFNDKIENGELKAKFGIRSLLKYLKSNNIKTAIASSSKLEKIKKRLVSAKVDISYFDKIIAGDMIKNNKPAPDSYLIACKELDIDAKNAIALEDSDIGIQSAVSAGLNAILIPDVVEPDENSKKMAYKIFNDLYDVSEFIKSSLGNFTYFDIWENLEYKKIYDSIDVVEHKDITYHGTNHIKNVIENTKIIFENFDFTDDEITAILIACAGHDIGKGYDQNGKKARNHGEAGKILLEKDFINKNIPYKNEILEAVKWHSTPALNDNIVGKTVCLADKLDITHKRIWGNPTTSDKTEYAIKHIEYFDFRKDDKKWILNLYIDDKFDFQCVAESAYLAESYIAWIEFTEHFGKKGRRKFINNSKS